MVGLHDCPCKEQPFPHKLHVRNAVSLLVALYKGSPPESSDALSGVLMLGLVCSTSTWISSVSSVFFL